MKRSLALVLAVLLAGPSSLLAQSPIGRVTPIAFASVSVAYASRSPDGDGHEKGSLVAGGISEPEIPSSPRGTLKLLNTGARSELADSQSVQLQPTTADIMAMLLKMQQQIDAIQAAQNGPNWIVSVLANREVQIFLGGLGTWAMCYASKKC